MTILTKDEIDTCALDGCRDDYAFAEEVEKAVLEKLAGMELPEPFAKLHGKAKGGRLSDHSMDVFTAAQLHQAFAQGAASQLSAEPFTHYRHYDEQVQPFADERTIPLYILKSSK